MSPQLTNDLQITADAYALYKRIVGIIQNRSLEILKDNLREEGKNVADVADVEKAYHRACQEAMGAAVVK